MTQSLTSLASSISSLASTVNSALHAPPNQEGCPGSDVEEGRWAKPRTVLRPQGSLPLPPRSTGSEASGAVFSSCMPSHQQKYVEKLSPKPPEDEDAFTFRGEKPVQ